MLGRRSDCCSNCDRLEPGFTASHLHRGPGFALAELAPVAICTACGREMLRMGAACARIAVDAHGVRSTLEKLVEDHTRVLTRRLLQPATITGEN